MGESLEEFKARLARRKAQSGSALPTREKSVVDSLGQGLNYLFGGIIENVPDVVREAKDIGVGGLGLLTLAGKDFIGENVENVTRLLPGTGSLDYHHNVTIDDALKPLPKGMWEDLTSKEEGYGSLEGIKHRVAERPLSVALDALDVLTLGGSALARGATRAAKTSKTVSRGLDDLVQGGEAGRAATTVDKIVPGLKYQRAGIEQFGEPVPLGGNIVEISSDVGRPHVRPAATNPAFRGAQNLRHKLRTEPRAALEEVAEGLSRQISEAVPGDPITDWRAQKAVVDEVLTVKGGRLLKEGPSKKLAERLSGRLVAETGAAAVVMRNKLTDAHARILKRLPKEDVPTFFEKFLGLQSHPSAGVSTFDDIAEALNGPLDSPRLQVIAAAVKPHVDRARQLVDEFSDPQVLRESTIGKRAAERFREELATSGRSLQRGVAWEDQLIPPERATLEAQVRLAGQAEVEAARAIVEVVGGEPLAAFKNGVVDDVADVIDDTRLLNLKEEASRWLQAGGTYTDLFERLYRPMQVKGAFETALKEGHAPKSQAFRDRYDDAMQNAPTAVQLHELRKADGVKAPSYYPVPDALTESTSSFLQKYRSHGMARAAKPKSFKRMEGETIYKFLEGVTDAFQTDPAEAYARLAAEVTGYEMTLRLVDRLKDDFGMRVDAREGIPDGWKAINPEALRIALRRNKDFKVGMAGELMDGVDIEEAWARTAKSVFANAKELEKLVANKAEIYMVPEYVAKQLDNVAQSVGGVKTRLFIDTPMKAWRNGTLLLRPAYYLNNIFGNTAFLNLQGGKLSGVIRQVDEAYRTQLKNMIDELGLTDQVEGGFWSDLVQRQPNLGRAGEFRFGEIFGKKGPTAKQIDKALKENRAYRTFHKSVEWGQVGNAAVENAYRRESFLTAAEKDLSKRGVKLAGGRFLRSHDRLNQIMKYGLENPKAAQRWVDEMNKTMNNYNALGPWERKVTKRFIAPFWPFFKHATKTFLRLPFEHPLKATVLRELGDLDREMIEEEVGVLPEWLEGARPAGPGLMPGTTRFESSKGANPFGNVIDTPAGILGPLPQIAFEQLFGQNPYTGRDLMLEDLVQPYGSDEYYQLEDGQAVPAERQFGVLAPNAPNILESLVNQVPFANLIRDVAAGGSRYDSGGVIANPDGTPKYPIDLRQKLLGLAGFPSFDFNVPQYQQRRAEEEQQAIQELLRRLGS